MSHKRQGKAKILSPQEIETLLRKGFIAARDQAFFIFCLYTACRLSEARRMPLENVFHGDSVLEKIVIPKQITKGQQGTRVIPTHPSLALFLQKYRQDSLKLSKLKELRGDWSHHSRDANGLIKTSQNLKCPHCASFHIFKPGKTEKNEQRYYCKKCSRDFKESAAFSGDPLVHQGLLSPHNLGVSDSNNFGLLFSDPDNPHLFPGKHGKGCLSQSGAMGIFSNALKSAGIVGASSHSCRRTALTTMHAAGTPLRVIQQISGHKDLGALQRYLEVSEEELKGAIAVLQ